MPCSTPCAPGPANRALLDVVLDSVRAGPVTSGRRTRRCVSPEQRIDAGATAIQPVQSRQQRSHADALRRRAALGRSGARAGRPAAHGARPSCRRQPRRRGRAATATAVEAQCRSGRRTPDGRTQRQGRERWIPQTDRAPKSASVANDDTRSAAVLRVREARAQAHDLRRHVRQHWAKVNQQIRRRIAARHSSSPRCSSVSSGAPVAAS